MRGRAAGFDVRERSVGEGQDRTKIVRESEFVLPERRVEVGVLDKCPVLGLMLRLKLGRVLRDARGDPVGVERRDERAGVGVPLLTDAEFVSHGVPELTGGSVDVHVVHVFPVPVASTALVRDPVRLAPADPAARARLGGEVGCDSEFDSDRTDRLRPLGGAGLVGPERVVPEPVHRGPAHLVVPLSPVGGFDRGCREAVCHFHVVVALDHLADLRRHADGAPPVLRPEGHGSTVDRDGFDLEPQVLTVTHARPFALELRHARPARVEADGETFDDVEPGRAVVVTLQLSRNVEPLDLGPDGAGSTRRGPGEVLVRVVRWRLHGHEHDRPGEGGDRGHEGDHRRE